MDGIKGGGMVAAQFKLGGTAIPRTGSTWKNSGGGLPANGFEPGGREGLQIGMANNFASE